jgi:hypothetical protein
MIKLKSWEIRITIGFKITLFNKFYLESKLIGFNHCFRPLKLESLFVLAIRHTKCKKYWKNER